MIILDSKQTMPRTGGPSFSFGNRLFRLFWGATWVFLAAWTPPVFVAWRRFLLRMFGARIHPTAMVYGSANVWYPPNLEMAEYSCLGPHVNCYSMAKISLGPYALISQGTQLCAGSHDIDDVNFQLIARPINVGPHAWVAAEAFVGPGVTIGEGTVLGARAVAFKDLAPWTVYVGNPAKITRERHFRPTS
jgi:putative colanic acid biosynthesis acetyltransferase WcaF